MPVQHLWSYTRVGHAGQLPKIAPHGLRNVAPQGVWEYAKSSFIFILLLHSKSCFYNIFASWSTLLISWSLWTHFKIRISKLKFSVFIHLNTFSALPNAFSMFSMLILPVLNVSLALNMFLISELWNLPVRPDGSFPKSTAFISVLEKPPILQQPYFCHDAVLSDSLCCLSVFVLSDRLFPALRCLHSVSSVCLLCFSKSSSPGHHVLTTRQSNYSTLVSLYTVLSRRLQV